MVQSQEGYIVVVTLKYRHSLVKLAIFQFYFIERFCCAEILGGSAWLSKILLMHSIL